MTSHDDDDEEKLFEPEDQMSRAQAARKLGVSERTVARMAENGDLERDDEGKFSKAQVESLAAGEKEDQTVKALKMALDHNERLMALIEKPLKILTDTLVQSNERLNERVKSQEAAHLESIQALGDILMQKEEREAMRKKAEAQTEFLKGAGNQVVSMLPMLLSQFANGRKNPVKAFFAALSDEEKEAIKSLGNDFEGDKKKLFDEMMNGV